MGHTLLVVDDEVIVRKNIERAASESGCFTVLSASRTKEAMEIILSERVDAMLLDITMPRQNGIEFLREINELGIPMPITAIISGYDMFEYAQQAIGLSVVSYVLKPVDSNDIRELCYFLKDKLPTETSKTPVDGIQRQSRLMKGVQTYVKTHYAEDIGLGDISSYLNFSPNYVGRVYKEQTGLSIVDYITLVRIEKAKSLMATSDELIYEIAHKVGFRDQHYFSTVFKKLIGQTPKEYIQSLKEQV